MLGEVLLLLLCVVVSLIVAGLAGRGAGYAAWGLVGPIGWVIAAIHGAEDRLRARNPATARTLEVTRFGETLQCPSCRTDLDASTADTYGELRCSACGEYVATTQPAATDDA